MGNVAQIIKTQTETGIQPEKQGSQGTEKNLTSAYAGLQQSKQTEPRCLIT